MFTLATEIDIDIKASPNHVWQVLMGFDAHPQWHLFTVGIKGGRHVGDTLYVTIKQDKPILSRPAVTAYCTNQESLWLIKPFLKPSLMTTTQSCFESMNIGLKHYCEAIV